MRTAHCNPISLCIFQLLSQFFIVKTPTLNGDDDCLHHLLTDIVRTIHIIEVIIMPVFHEVVSEAFENFEQDGYGFA